MDKDSMDKELRDKQLFDSIATNYARKDTIISSMQARRAQLYVALDSILQKKDSLGTIVEIGCGIGASAKYLEPHYDHFIGVDQAPEMIKEAEQFNKGNPKTQFIADNIKTAGIPPNTADMILSDGALHHMSDLDDIISLLCTIAKPGAYLVAREPQNGNPIIQFLRWARSVLDNSYSEEQIYFSESQLTSLYHNHGLTNITATFHGLLSPLFAQVILNPQAVTVPLSQLSINMDAWSQNHLSKAILKMGFNIIVVGQFPKE